MRTRSLMDVAGWEAFLHGVFANHWFLILGRVYLMIVSTVPFVTALLAEYIGKDGGRDRVALVIFTVWQLVLSLLANALLLWASHHGRLLKPGIHPSALRSWKRIAAIGPVIWLAALASALLVSGTVTLILMAAILVIFMLEVPGVTTDDQTEAADTPA